MGLPLRHGSGPDISGSIPTRTPPSAGQYACSRLPIGPTPRRRDCRLRTSHRFPHRRGRPGSSARGDAASPPGLRDRPRCRVGRAGSYLLTQGRPIGASTAIPLVWRLGPSEMTPIGPIPVNPAPPLHAPMAGAKTGAMLRLFFPSADGGLHTSVGDPNHVNGFQVADQASGHLVHPFSGLTAAMRRADVVDLIAIDQDGALGTTGWTTAQSGRSTWTAIGAAGTFFPSSGWSCAIRSRWAAGSGRREGPPPHGESLDQDARQVDGPLPGGLQHADGPHRDRGALAGPSRRRGALRRDRLQRMRAHADVACPRQERPMGRDAGPDRAWSASRDWRGRDQHGLYACRPPTERSWAGTGGQQHGGCGRVGGSGTLWGSHSNHET